MSYETDAVAFEAYSRVQNAIFGTDCDLSAYRIRLSQIPHVVVLGVQPPANIHDKLSGILSGGRAASLPKDVSQYLTQRRAQAKRIGPWVEGHYRPGRQV